MPQFQYGGQALLEGVLMRGRHAVGVAFRAPDGGIVTAREPLDSLLHRSRFAATPFFRGLVVLYETLVIGTRWLMRAGSLQAAEEGVELGRRGIALTLLMTLGLAVGLFVLLPLFLAQLATRAVSDPSNLLLQNAIEGVVQVFIFVGYLLLVSTSSEVRRVFQYHGAEHMTIHALEHGDPLTVDRVRPYPTAHPRCGTEFLVVLVIVNIFAFSIVSTFIGGNVAATIVSRVLLIPVIAAVSYELLRFGAKHRSNPLIRWLFMPGMWLQAITTKRPDDGMIEVAIVSMREALAANGDPVPAGTIDPPTRTLATVRAELAAQRAAADGGATAAPGAASGHGDSRPDGSSLPRPTDAPPG
jgi:uncharacterized protein YqhQ